MTNSQSKQKPRLLNINILELLGYRPTGRGIGNEAKKICILELERTDDESIPDFVYCCHPEKDWGFIDEHPLEYHTSRVPVRTQDGEIQFPQE